MKKTTNKLATAISRDRARLQLLLMDTDDPAAQQWLTKTIDALNAAIELLDAADKPQEPAR